MCHVLGVDLAHFVGYLLSWDLGLQQCFLPERSEENKGAMCGVHQRQILGFQMRGQEFSMEERSLCHDLTPCPRGDPEKKAKSPLLSCPELCGGRGGPYVLLTQRVSAPFLPTDQGAGLGLRKVTQGLGVPWGLRSQEANLGVAEPGERPWVAGFFH